MRFYTPVTTAMIVAASTLLSGCDSGPTLEEVQAMVDAEKNAAVAASGPAGALAKSLMPEIKINAVKNCEEVRDDVYRCDVETSTKMFGQKVEEVKSVQLTKGSKGTWTAVN